MNVKRYQPAARRSCPPWRWILIRLLLSAALIVPLGGCTLLAGAAAGGAAGYVAGHEAGEDSAHHHDHD